MARVVETIGFVAMSHQPVCGRALLLPSGEWECIALGLCDVRCGRVKNKAEARKWLRKHTAAERFADVQDPEEEA